MRGVTFGGCRGMPSGYYLSARTVRHVTIYVLLLRPPLGARPRFRSSYGGGGKNFRKMVSGVDGRSVGRVEGSFHGMFKALNCRLARSVGDLSRLGRLGMFCFGGFAGMGNGLG